ncbi:MAG: type II secretion system protein N [Rhodanobacter sp.]
MKYLRITLAGLALLVVLAALLLWFLPARWVMPWIEPQLSGLHLRQLHGSVWNGEADEVTGVKGKRLGQLHWQLSRRALLGDARLQLAFDGSQLGFSGIMRRLPEGRTAIDNLRLRTDLAVLGAYPPSLWGRPLGELQLTARHVVLQGGWPLQGQARGLWQHAAVHTRDGDVAFGALQLEAQAQGGVIRAQWHDVGTGPLWTNGELQLSPLGWRLDTTLRARQTDLALQRWLARLGPVAGDGSVHIQQSGGLAGTAPSTDQGTTPP